MPSLEKTVRKILVVDDHVLFREGLVSLLKNQDDFQVVGEAGNIEEAAILARETEPDIILMDYSLPDGTGTQASRTILSIDPNISIVILTIHDDDDFLFDAIRSGAKGYLLKKLPVANLLNALRGLSRREAAISREMVGRVITEFANLAKSDPTPDLPSDSLTPRQMEVFKLLARGASNNEIAEHLFISVNTVKNHIHAILSKLELQNRRELIRYTKRTGLNP